MITTEQFLGICHDQDVTLYFDPTRHPETYKFEVKTYEPQGILTAISEAGRVLRTKPGSELADRHLRPNRLTNADFGASVLISVINDSLSSESPNNHNLFSIDCENVRSIDVCEFAETSFAKTIQALKKPFAIPGMLGSDIVLDEADNPLFIRKNLGVSSALSLQPFVVNGVRYPAGSLARLELLTDPYYDRTKQVHPSPPFDSINVVRASDITALSFQRLSAFSFPQGQRRDFKKPLESMPENIRRIIRWMPLSTVLERAFVAAQQIEYLELAGRTAL